MILIARSRNKAAIGLLGAVLTGSSIWPSHAAAQTSPLPPWLQEAVGEGEGQIARQVLVRARALYQRKVREGAVRNPCYFAMDATRPNTESNGRPGRRFYVICESQRTFLAIPSGHGSGRKLPSIGDFSNDRLCARNFGNALDSELTTGGAYTTAEVKASFKGYYRASINHDVALVRTFLQFEGEGETANARQRAIGGHAAVVLKGLCLRRQPQSAYADKEGYVPYGSFVDYSGGRSNGCTSWSSADAAEILEIVKDKPTTVYIYPESADIEAVSQAKAAGKSPAQSGLYWNATCLRQIGTPRFWSKERLEPLLARYKREHPTPPPGPLPFCKG